jgi:endogenous inhibitor of DNA gyrase (YacG/DUF329 family)
MTASEMAIVRSYRYKYGDLADEMLRIRDEKKAERLANGVARGSTVVLCSFCEKPITKFNTRVRNYKDAFCDRKCKGLQLTRWRPPKTKLCHHCGKPVTRPSAQFRAESKHHFCNKKCFADSIRWITPEMHKVLNLERAFKNRYGPFWKGMQILVSVEKKAKRGLGYEEQQNVHSIRVHAADV